jgi:hypothetical protein
MIYIIKNPQCVNTGDKTKLNRETIKLPFLLRHLAAQGPL